MEERRYQMTGIVYIPFNRQSAFLLNCATQSPHKVLAANF